MMIGPPSAMLRANRSMAFGSNAAGLVGWIGAGSGAGGGAGGRATATQTRTNLSVPLSREGATTRPLRRATSSRITLSKLYQTYAWTLNHTQLNHSHEHMLSVTNYAGIMCHEPTIVISAQYVRNLQSPNCSQTKNSAVWYGIVVFNVPLDTL